MRLKLVVNQESLDNSLINRETFSVTQ